MDFTIDKYKQLLQALNEAGYESVLRFCDTLKRQVLLRHDVDARPQNSLVTARIESERGMNAIYYFRAIPGSWEEGTIREIAALGHEIGYHYESLTTCKGDMDLAYKDFCTHYDRLNQLLGHQVKTICMHGSPRSVHDSRDIWKKYDYKELGIDYEPYFDTDWSRTVYLTDTGRCWDGWRMSVRDKIKGWQEQWESNGLRFHHTDDIIAFLYSDKASSPREVSRLLITTHPQRWNSTKWGWFKELVMQNAKNQVKKYLGRKTTEPEFPGRDNNQ